MSKTIYEEALADAKQLKEVAVKNAQRAIIDTVTPKIKELFEKQLLGESCDEDEEEEDEILLDEDGFGGSVGTQHPSLDNVSKDSSSETDEEQVEEQDESLELTNETAVRLGMLGSQGAQDRLEVNVYRIVEATNGLVSTSNEKRKSEEYSRKIVETIQKIEDIYSYLQESGDSTRKNVLEKKLENCFEVLNAVKESTMRMKDLLSRKNLLEDLDMDPMGGAPADPNAAPAPDAAAGVPGGKELVMKVTGLPDDVELDKLNIDLISDEEGAEPPMDDMDQPDLDAGGAATPGAMESDYAMEGDEMADDLSELDEDDVVEISETMLKKELARLLGKGLNEMDSDVLDDFGGGSDEGDPWLDGEVSTSKKDNMVKQRGNDMGAKTGGKKALAAVKAAIAERKALENKKRVTETSRNEVSRQVAESNTAIKSLRKQLTETILFNAKLLHANKLLQLEGLTAHAKSVIIDKLDNTQNLREVKLAYENLVNLLKAKPKKQVAEGTQSRAVLAGSSSRTVRSSTSTADDGFETARWAQLAGIKK